MPLEGNDSMERWNIDSTTENIKAQILAKWIYRHKTKLDTCRYTYNNASYVHTGTTIYHFKILAVLSQDMTILFLIGWRKHSWAWEINHWNDKRQKVWQAWEAVVQDESQTFDLDHLKQTKRKVEEPWTPGSRDSNQNLGPNLQEICSH